MFVIISIINFPFQLGFGITPQAMLVFVILFTISIVNGYFQLRFECPTKNVRFCHLCNHFDNELSFSVGI